MNYKYVTWNNFDTRSVALAEKKKATLENSGYILVHETTGCLTYKKEQTNIEEIYLDEERYNPAIDAIVPGAWIVRYKNGKEVVICREYEAKNESEALTLLV